MSKILYNVGKCQIWGVLGTNVLFVLFRAKIGRIRPKKTLRFKGNMIYLTRKCYKTGPKNAKRTVSRMHREVAPPPFGPLTSMTDGLARKSQRCARNLGVKSMQCVDPTKKPTSCTHQQGPKQGAEKAHKKKSHDISENLLDGRVSLQNCPFCQFFKRQTTRNPWDIGRWKPVCPPPTHRCSRNATAGVMRIFSILCAMCFPDKTVMLQKLHAENQICPLE